jgi:hypothetical protein
MASWQNSKLAKWHVGKMACWQMASWKMVSWQMASWQNGMLAKWHVGKSQVEKNLREKLTTLKATCALKSFTMVIFNDSISSKFTWAVIPFIQAMSV